jgi:rhodanese-related sulfurtransferase
MVTRFREELHRQPTVEQAAARTVATAGRTVAVSGITVALALTSLMLFPEDFLRSMGFGGVATVAVDMLAALTVLPALLAVLGPKVNALRIRRSVYRPVRDEAGGAAAAAPAVRQVRDQGRDSGRTGRRSRLTAPPRPGGPSPARASRGGYSSHRGPTGGRCQPARGVTQMNQPVAVPEVMSADLPAGVFLLDVREDDEWTAGHAPEAVHVRLGDLGVRLGDLPRDRELYVICRSGNRSAYAAQALAARGLNTVNVSDGMTGWAVAGRPMVSEDGTEPHVA